MRALDEPPPAPDGAQAVSGRQAPFGHRMPEALRRQNAGIVQPRVSFLRFNGGLDGTWTRDLWIDRARRPRLHRVAEVV